MNKTVEKIKAIYDDKNDTDIMIDIDDLLLLTYDDINNKLGYIDWHNGHSENSIENKRYYLPEWLYNHINPKVDTQVKNFSEIDNRFFEKDIRFIYYYKNDSAVDPVTGDMGLYFVTIKQLTNKKEMKPLNFQPKTNDIHEFRNFLIPYYEESSIQ